MALDQATKLHLEKELLPFLRPDARDDLKYFAVRSFLELTGTQDGINFISEGDKFLKAIMALTSDKETDICKNALFTLINLTADDKAAWKLMEVDGSFVHNLLHKMLQSDYEAADQAASVIANVTRIASCARKLAHQILAKNSKVSMDNIVNVLCKVNYNEKATLHYLGLILSNLTQVPDIRKTIMDKDRCIIQKLLPFTEYKDSLKRRGGIIGTLKNCCFEYEYHEWLLSEDIDILSRLLLPLAGGEEFDDDDMERLPVDLQYLPPDKTREEDPDLRTMLVEAITQLCSTKGCRVLIKEKNTYVIMRELHRWEKDPTAKLATQKLCELLIAEEPEVGMEDLHKVEVAEHLQKQFDDMNDDMLNDFKKDAAAAADSGDTKEEKAAD